MIAVFACNLRFFTRAFMSSVPRGVYRRPRKPMTTNTTAPVVVSALPLLHAI